MPTGRARNINSIANRTNNCGGPKKAGLAPSVGSRSRFVMKTIKVNAVNTIPVVKCGSGGRGCPRNFSNNPGGQACGGVGRMAQLATRGIVPPGGRSRGGVPRETITLAAARAQNGVRANQDLVLRTDNYEQDGNDVSGLRIRDNQTFTLAAGGTITFADPIAAAGSAVGIRNAGTFTQQGGTITFEGAITSTAGTAATGIYNDLGTFRQEGGAITFEGDITFRGDNNNFTDGIYNTATFTQQGGTITFRGAITGTRDTTGIYNDPGTFRQEGGAITFEGLLDGAIIRLVNADNATPDSFTVNGTIAFPGTNEYNANNFNPNDADGDDRFTGTGTITYNNDNETPNIYYQDL
jgi:hypothetical protein